MHGMCEPAFHRAAGRDQSLTDHLPAEHALPSDLRRAPAKQVHFERFEVEDFEEFLDGGGHAAAFGFQMTRDERRRDATQVKQDGDRSAAIGETRAGMLFLSSPARHRK